MKNHTGEADWADMQITMAVDGSTVHHSVGALGLTWNGCPGQRASAEEKRFTDGACGQVTPPHTHRHTTSPHPLFTLLNPSLKASSLPSSFLYLTPHAPPPPVSNILRGNATRCPVSKRGIMFLEDVLVIQVFARLLIIIMLSRSGKDEGQERTTGSHLWCLVTWCNSLCKTRSYTPRGDTHLFVLYYGEMGTRSEE